MHQKSHDSEAELRAQLAAIVVSSDDAIVSKTLDGVITSWNRGAERVFGYTADEAVGQHISLIIPPERRAEEEDVLARLRRGEKIDHFETVRRAKDGRRVDISLTVSPIKGADGRIVGASKVARDVTERRLAEEALAEGRLRYQRIFETAGVSIWEEDFSGVMAELERLRADGVHDVAGYFRQRPEEVERYIRLVKIVDVNETTIRMFGAPDKAMLLESLTTIFDEGTRQVFADELVALAEGRTRFEAESTLRTLRGERLDVLVSITLPSPGKRADSVLVTLTDITLRKRAEEAIRDSEALFHEMADTAPAMLWISDAAGAWTFLSHQWYQRTKQTAEQSLGLGWLDAVYPDDRRIAAETFFEATRHRQPFQFECRLKGADGGYCWTINAGRPRVGAHGEFLGFVGSVIDITARRQAEEAIIDEVHTREMLLHVGASLASELDPDAMVQSAIDAATALTTAQFGAFFYRVVDDAGNTQQHVSVCGMPQEALPGVAGFFEAATRPGVVRIDDLQGDRRYGDGRHAPLFPDDLPVRSYLAVPVISRNGQVWGGLLFGHAQASVFVPKHEQLAAGIASWAALSLDNARLYKEAQEANRAKDDFMATLSHELRTPLNAMLGWAHMLRSSVLPPDTQRRALETLERNVRVQAQLVDDLLDVSGIVAGKLQIKADEVDLTALIVGGADSVRPSAIAKSLTLGLTLDSDQRVIVVGDADRLRQIVWNLLTNAVKFTPKGGRIDLELRHDESTASIVVQDTGYGIRPDFLPHVFERFRQADSGTSRKHGGLGLGLAIVRHLAEAHGGSVSVASEGEGRGATFTVQLPLRAVRSGVEPADGLRKPQGSALAGLRVLLVDDEADTRGVLAMLLELEGAHVLMASSAGQALDALRRDPIDVLLADIGMPEQDGYSLIEAVRALPMPWAAIPAIAVTAYVSTRDRARAFDAGYGWHLAKPVDPDQLVALVSTAARSVAPAPTHT
jgi:PAS domain S-box-containing protein